MVRKVTDMKSVRALFEGWEETMIWSCLQGIMGAVYADYQAGQELPQSAMAVLGDFVFLAGKPSEELLLFYPQTGSPEENHSEAEGLSKEVIPEREKTGCIQILVPRSRAWERLIEKVYESEFQSENMKKIIRYAIKKEPEIWKTASRRKKLEKIAAALPEEYELRLIDQELYEAAYIDGAGRAARMRYISIPGILPTIMVMLLLNIGNIMQVSFEKVILLQKPITVDVSEVINSYVYKRGLLNMDYSYGTAMGLLQSLIGFILVTSANAVSKRLTETALW